MDASTRWETEAIRSGSSKRTNPPRPTSKQEPQRRRDRTWVTLKEAEEATGIPTNTLRKWVRKEAVETYLESDGEMALRMVDLDSVRERAAELGRTLSAEIPDTGSEQDHRSQITDHSSEQDHRSRIREPRVEEPGEVAPPGTMLVPVDAWNKMLGQLGNLHEAGQQLAEARERAAKAETEATFLRERLKELRDQKSEVRSQTPVQAITDHRSQITEGSQNTEPGYRTTEAGAHSGKRKAESAAEGVKQIADGGQPPQASTTYWRYLTTGWRDRKRRDKS